MIEACINANDLKGASDFLMKMEAAGHSPELDLLDKVMDLYSQHKMLRASDTAMPAPSMFVGEEKAQDDGPRAKLSSGAPIFVPMFMSGTAQPPPPPPLAMEDGDGGART